MEAFQMDSDCTFEYCSYGNGAFSRSYGTNFYR